MYYTKVYYIYGQGREQGDEIFFLLAAKEVNNAESKLVCYGQIRQ